jgi:pilus assembly protein Flp/PilA
MLNYLTTWMQLKTDRRAVTALEYGLIASLIAVIIIGGVSLIGTNLSAMFTKVAGDL